MKVQATAVPDVRKQQPLRAPPSYWIIETLTGRKVVNYRPNTSARSVGPFMTRWTATLKMQELDGRAKIEREALAIGLAIGLLGGIFVIGAVLI